MLRLQFCLPYRILSKTQNTNSCQLTYNLFVRSFSEESKEKPRADSDENKKQTDQKRRFEERKAKAERQELADLQRKIAISGSRDSVFSDFLKILRWKLLIPVLLGGGLFVGYFYLKDSEFHLDPLENKRIFLPLNYAKG